MSTTVTVFLALSPGERSDVEAAATAAAQSYIDNLASGDELVINTIAASIRAAHARIIDVGQPNLQIPEIYLWRSRTDATRYSRFLLNNYTPKLGERIVVELQSQLTNPVRITAVTE